MQDCFEVSMTRERFPELVPFRLTRMLVQAMEAAGIEGTYRSTCENVMRVLRLHRDSVMAMLEAFVHDPLLNWRLTTTAVATAAAATTGTTTTTTTTGEDVTTSSSSSTAAAGTKEAAGTTTPSILGDNNNNSGSSSTAAPNSGGDNNCNNGNLGPVSGVSKLTNDANLARTLTNRGLLFSKEVAAAALRAAKLEAGLEEDITAATTTTTTTEKLQQTASGASIKAACVGGVNDASVAALSSALLAKSLVARQTTGSLISAVTPAFAGGQNNINNNNNNLSGGGGGGSRGGGSLVAGGGDGEVLNERAVAVLRRIQSKLTGRDFSPDDPIGALMGLGVGTRSAEAPTGLVDIGLDETGELDIPAQVQRLILAATSHENLAQAWMGWCSFW